MMGRDYLFRVWDIKDKVMQEVYEIKWLYNDKYAVEIIGDTYRYTEFSKPDIDYVLMQGTGRKDKNQKEIFEADKVACDGKICQVVWNEERLSFGLLVIKSDSGVCMGLTIPMWQYGDKEIEIIGNIHDGMGVMGNDCN